MAGNLAAGIILYRLIFWKPTRTVKNRLMFAKSYSEIMFETGLTHQQVKDGLNRLRKKGLIQTAQSLFQGKNVMHVLVTEACKKALIEAATDVPKDPAQVVSNDPTQVVSGGTASYTTYMQGESQGESQGDCAQACAGGFSGEKSESGFGEGKKVKVKKPRPTSVKEAILAHKGPPIGGKLHKPDSVKALESVWKVTVSEEFDKYVAPLTMKQQSQLKMFRGKCPSGKCEMILRHVLRNWVEFTKSVQMQAGIKATPSEPSIDFLLKHAEVAVNLSFEPNKKPQVSQEASSGKVSAGKVQLIATDEDEDQPQTFEELMAIIGEEQDE